MKAEALRWAKTWAYILLMILRVMGLLSVHNWAENFDLHKRFITIASLYNVFFYT